MTELPDDTIGYMVLHKCLWKDASVNGRGVSNDIGSDGYFLTFPDYEQALAWADGDADRVLTYRERART